MDTNINTKLIKFASYLSVITAIIILIIKNYGWVNTQSQSIFASLVDSVLDITSALINLIAVYLSTQPPDNNHRFGHEKFEDLAVFSQSIFFVCSGLFVIISCVRSLFSNETIVNQDSGIQIMIICIILTFIMSIFQNYVVKKTGSTIIAVDRIHYINDLLSHIAVLISVILSEKFHYIDSLMGICIGLYIIYNAYFLFKHAIRNLADEEFDDIEKQKITDVVNKFPQVSALLNIKTRYAGNKPFIQFHIEMDPAMTLEEAHEISNNINLELKKHFPLGEVIIYHRPHDRSLNSSSPPGIRVEPSL